MGKNQGHNRRRLADMSTQTGEAPEDTRWRPPPKDECTEHTTEFAVGGPGQKAKMRLVQDQNDRFADFGVTQMTCFPGKEYEVVRVDTAHGTVHVHQLYRSSDKDQIIRDLFTIRRQEDVERGLDLAIDFILENWEENRRRWRDGR